jgi:hypothetical protein
LKRLLVVALLALAGAVDAASVATHLTYPPLPPHFGNLGPNTTGVLLMDASGEKATFIFGAAKTGTLSRLRFRTGTVGTGDTVRASFQNVDLATGMPDETADQYRDVTVGNGDDNVAHYTGILSSDGTDTGTKRSVSAGDLVAIVFEYPSYVAGNLNIATQTGSSGVTNFPYSALKTGGSWAKSTTGLPIVAVEYDDGSYAWIPGATAAVSGIASEAYSSSSTPDERGNIIVPTFTGTVCGFWFVGSPSGDTDIVLYNSVDGVVLSKSLDKDTIATAAVHKPTEILFNSTATLTASATYRLVAKPTTTSNTNLSGWSYPAAAVLGAEPAGTQVYSTTRTDGGAWTDAQTKRYGLGLFLCELESGSGGVSAARVPNGM